MVRRSMRLGPRRRAQPIGFATWLGARVAPQQSPILRPGTAEVIVLGVRGQYIGLPCMRQTSGVWGLAPRRQKWHQVHPIATHAHGLASAVAFSLLFFPAGGFRKESPSKTMTWEWWSRRSMAAVARSASPKSG